jgi:mRNA interferase HicA
MNYGAFRRWLSKQGCTFETHEGGSGHITVRYKDRKTQLPAHGKGKGKDLGTGLVHAIKKQLGLK